MHVTIDEFWLTFLVATVLPALTALITKRFAPGSTKALVLTALSVIAGWLTSLQATGGDFDLKAAVVAVVTTFVTAVATHYGLLQPLAVTGSSGAIQRSVPGGIGSDAGTSSTATGPLAVEPYETEALGDDDF